MTEQRGDAFIHIFDREVAENKRLREQIEALKEEMEEIRTENENYDKSEGYLRRLTANLGEIKDIFNNTASPNTQALKQTQIILGVSVFMILLSLVSIIFMGEDYLYVCGTILVVILIPLGQALRVTHQNLKEFQESFAKAEEIVRSNQLNRSLYADLPDYGS